ncbi:MAG TPA: NAD(+)--dinitrogen-reductase ADP-D-ribosyltransferase [Rhodospirillales bacterium]|nr:NAD(+)--dinitrogen-reductase ADP-D-ribosyltransferase [Rhodospirillales bacterium]
MDSEILPGAWQRGDSTTLVGVPSARLNSAAFNDAPVPLHIAGVREANETLFVLLSLVEDPALAASAFEAYMTAMFGAAPSSERKAGGPDDRGPEGPPAQRHYRASYLRLLRGWAYDSNGREGAVLKGWVESRFGLMPTFHKEPIRRFASPQWARYVEEKMSNRFHSNAIWSQLDLLYEFAQWVLARRAMEGSRHLVLFRGVNDFDEHQIIERLEKRVVIVRLNNLVSFTADRDVATWFGDIIMEAAVPYEKVLFFNTLLPHHPLKGEGEVLVIGGDYKVRATYG